MLRKIRASVSSFMELLKRFSLLFLNLRINPKQKISCLSLLFCFFTSHVLLLCSVLSLLYSSLSRSLLSLSQLLALGVGVLLWWPPACLFLEEV